MLEPGLEHRGRAPVVLGGAEHDDRVGRALVIALALLPDSQGGDARDERDRKSGDDEQAHDQRGDAGRQAPWHFLYFWPDPHQHGSLRPIRAPDGV